MQCCQPGQRCPFYTTCSGGTLFAQSTRVFCDQGTCNTAIVVSDLGPSDRSSYLACWATSFGTSPIFIMQGALSRTYQCLQRCSLRILILLLTGGCLAATTTPTIGSASSGASLTPTTSTSSPSPSSRAKSDVTSKKNLDGGATAGITISGVAVLLCCVALYRWWRKRNKNKKDVTRDKSIVAENNNWEKPEIDGKSVAFAELYAEKEATELPSTTITPVELPAGAPPSPQEFHSRQDRL